MRLEPFLLLLLMCLTAISVSAAIRCTSIRLHPETWVGAKADSLIRSARATYEGENDYAHDQYEGVLRGIAVTLKRCKLSADEGFNTRYRQFIEYVETASLDTQPGHELGFIVPDKQYFEETSELVKIPEFLLDQRFLRAVSRTETLNRAKSYLRGLNEFREPGEQLLFFSYKSRHLGTPDNIESFRRLLIVVPGDAARGIPEKWVQFGVTDPGVHVRTRNVSVVSAMSSGDGTYDAYFKDSFRTFRRNGAITIKGRWDLGYGDDNCAQCHKSGVLPIFPVDGSVPKSELPLVEAVNERFRSYGSPRFGKYLDVSKFGPGISFASREDREMRFGPKFGESNVSDAMECSKCHTSDGLGFLSWPMDKTILKSFVTGGQMPRGHDLPEGDRRALYRKLIQEYFSTDRDRPGILKAWLLGRID